MQENQQQQQQEAGLHFLDYWRVIRSRKEIILAVTLLVVLTGAAYTFTLPRIFMAQARILVRDDSLDVPVFEQRGGYLYNPFFLRTQYEVITSKPILYTVIDNLNLQQTWGEKFNQDKTPLNRELALRILSNSLNVQQFRDTSLIAIIVKREDAVEAARIANEVASVYREQRLSLKRHEMQRGVEAMRVELDKQREKVNAGEKEVERLRKSLDINVIGQMRVDQMRLQQLQADLINARVDMIARKARLDEIRGLEGDMLLEVISYLFNDPQIGSLRKQIIDTDVQLSLMLQTLGENHPDVKRLRAGREETMQKLNAALSGLKRGIESEYNVSLARYNVLDSELKAARETEIESSSEKFLPFTKAQQELEMQRQMFNALQARVLQEGIQNEIPRTPVEVVDPAEPSSRPVSPNLVLNVLLSLFIGLGSGIGLAYFIEYLDTSVKTVDDVERYLGLPVIGVIPQKVRPLIEEGPDSPHAEAYRVLRTNMIFANKGTAGGAFAVMSGGVGEGKSTTIFNIAYVCAIMGDKVLIVDSDMRRPVQHTILGMQNRFGLTNVLMRDVPIEETIKPVPNVPNLHFLPSGKLPRSSIGILNSQRMRELIKNLKTRYDYVFFDSPPVVGISDASILASEVDGVLLVVQYRKYPRLMSSRAKRMIENVGGNIVGVVLNNINIMRDDYYYYYHSYYSNYYQQPEETPKSES